MNNSFCTTCGRDRGGSSDVQIPGQPCPSCGGTGVTIELTSEAVEGISESHASPTLMLGEQVHNWQQAWEDAQRELRHLREPHDGPMTYDTIRTEVVRLQSFYVRTYHIKDALKNQASTTGIPPEDVEKSVTRDSALALLADLANLDKHVTLTQPLRSGHVPSINKEVIAHPANQPPGTWQLGLTIDHAGRALDGIEVAQNAVDAWRRTLSNWGVV